MLGKFTKMPKKNKSNKKTKKGSYGSRAIPSKKRSSNLFYAIIASSLSAILVLIIAPIIGVGHPILKFDDVSPAGDSEVITHKDLANSVMYQVKAAVRIKNYSLFSIGHIEDVRLAPLTLDEPVEFSVKELDRKDIGWLESRLIYATLHMKVPFPKKNKYKYTLHWLDGNGKEVTSTAMDITTLPFRYSYESN